MAAKKKKKSFFFRIEASDLMCAVLDIPEEDRGVWVTTLAADLLRDDPDAAKTEFGKEVITEALDFREQKAKAGSKGGKSFHPSKQEAEGKHCLHDAEAEGNQKVSKQEASTNSSTVQKQYSTEDKPKDKPLRFSAMSLLKDKGVDDELAKDWLSVRKTKKATNSKTAFNSIENQVEKSGKTWNEIAKLCCEKSWSGFNAEWLENVKGENYEKGTNSSKLDIETSDETDWTAGF